MLRNWVMKPLMKLDVKNPQHVDMVWTTMYEMVAEMEPRHRLMMMNRVVPRMMDRCFESVSPPEMISGVRETVLGLLESCCIRMKTKQRRKMISICRELLEEIEIRYDQLSLSPHKRLPA